jgi:hypothetical protein
MNSKVAKSAPRAESAGVRSFCPVVEAATRASGSSKVPKKSRMPKVATKRPPMPMVTPQRNCASSAMKTKATRPPTRAIAVPRTMCSLLPRTRSGLRLASTVGKKLFFALDTPLTLVAGTAGSAAAAGGVGPTGLFT